MPSILKQWLYKINTTYYNYLVADKHPAIKFVMSALSWIIWTIIALAFFSLLYFEHYIIWLVIVLILALIETSQYLTSWYKSLK